MDLKLKDKIVLVTGGSTGIGAAISEAFAREGSKLVVAYHSAHRLESTLAMLGDLNIKYGTEGIAVQGDAGLEEDAVRMFDEAEDRIGPVDILINNAGYLNKTPFLDITYEEWQRSLHNNSTGMLFMTREFVKRRIRDGKGGRIVNTLSKVAITSKSKNRVCYTTAKDVELGLTRQTVVDFASHDIVANGVCVGLVKTDLNADDPLMEQKEARTPYHRAIRPEEIADIVVFLASERAGGIAGAAVDASQGMLLGF